ncbi:MAG: hypothetical protein AAF153_02135, partial [Pseudomonadota bacterium]
MYNTYIYYAEAFLKFRLCLKAVEWIPENITLALVILGFKAKAEQLPAKDACCGAMVGDDSSIYAKIYGFFIGGCNFERILETSISLLEAGKLAAGQTLFGACWGLVSEIKIKALKLQQQHNISDNNLFKWLKTSYLGYIVYGHHFIVNGLSNAFASALLLSYSFLRSGMLNINLDVKHHKSVFLLTKSTTQAVLDYYPEFTYWLLSNQYQYFNTKDYSQIAYDLNSFFTTSVEFCLYYTPQWVSQHQVTAEDSPELISATTTAFILLVLLMPLLIEERYGVPSNSVSDSHDNQNKSITGNSGHFCFKSVFVEFGLSDRDSKRAVEIVF